MIIMEILIVKNNYKKYYKKNWTNINFRTFINNKMIITYNDNTYYVGEIDKTNGVYDIDCIDTVYINYLFEVCKIYKIKDLTIQEYDLLNSNDSILINIGINYIIQRHRWKSITKKEFKIIRNGFINIKT